MVQVHVPARVWGFESLLRHQIILSLRSKPLNGIIHQTIFCARSSRAQRVVGFARRFELFLLDES